MSRQWQVRLASAKALPAAPKTLLETNSNSGPRLRAYQQECIDSCLRRLAEGERRQVVSLPVGSGKTVVMSNLIPRIPNPTPLATKTLILAHRSELLEQAQRQIQLFNPSLKVDIDQSRRKANLEEADVIIGSIQTLGRTGSARLDLYNPSLFKTIIIDEAHHASASTYIRILEHFGTTKEDSHIFLWGCSATVRRHDGISLGNVFGDVTFHMDFLSMIEAGWLCPMKVTTVKTNTDLSQVATRYDDFQQAQLAKIVNVDERNTIIVNTWKKYAEKRTCTLAFAVDMAHTLSLCNAFREKGIAAEFITSKTSQIERYSILDRFRNNEFPVLVNCGILTEGTDIPRIDCILMARPTRSSVLFQQMFGRGMRLHESKTDCLVIDFVDSFETKGRHGLITVPTLMGLDVNGMVEDEDVLDIERRAIEKEKEEETSRVIPLDKEVSAYEAPEDPKSSDSSEPPAINRIKIKVTEYDDLGEFMVDCSGSPSLRVASRNCWVAIGDDRCALTIMSKGGLILDKRNNVWYAEFRPELDRRRKKQKIYCRPQKVPLQADTRDAAIHAADTWVQKKLTQEREGRLLSVINRNARYREQRASPAQMKILTGYKFGHGLTKGQAMDLITRLKYGQGKIWQAELKRVKKEQLNQEKKRTALRRM
ncbi:hypothetical protein DFQ28_003613 [Apophysomyces sp. BC1034]|nr:hypothetical protein DFQ30_006404 [Apophysomyces sp. BC1015]KAG0179168.1 hypothetical protein DFQ29_002455 [Apophysomyces sp. BC1021]KAG0189265.1 hypothetical protein DFQ28_003613 [Apophysomyces sp. BC1034]